MNRPFSAFAALMTLLALAMFAVSSTSRSTTVGPEARAQTRVQGSGFRVQRAEVRGPRSEVRGPRSEGVGSGDRSLVATTSVDLRALKTSDCRLRSAMRPARILAAENTAARARILMGVDCRSHGDAFYDLVVYGIKDKSSAIGPAQIESEAVGVGLAGELDVIFHELASRQSKEPLPQAGALQLEIKTIRWNAIVAAVSGWVQYQVQQAVEMQTLAKKGPPTSAQVVAWTDYAEFADGVCGRKIANLEGTVTSDAKNGVRSGDWLRHSAAAGLYQMSLLLRAAANELDGVGAGTLSVESE